MRFLLLCTGLLLAAGTAQAQLHLSAGPALGYSYTRLTAPFPSASLTGPNYQHDGLWRPQAGIVTSARLGHFALQSAVLFLQKGATSESDVESMWNAQRYTRHNEDNVKVNYLEIPLNLVATLGRQGNGLQLLGGPYMAIALKATGHFRSYPVGPTPTSTNPEVNPGAVYDYDLPYTIGEPESHDYGYGVLRRVDWGANAGLGYARGHWQLQAIYSLSLREQGGLVQRPGFSYSYTYLPHRTWQARLSYLIGGQKERQLPGFLKFLNLKPAQ